jgi:hypothetical protein
MALWVNLHLGFYFGLMLLACWLASLCIDATRGRDVPLRRPILVAAACVIATWANPSGPAILWYPARYVFDSQATNLTVAEWQSPNILLPGHWSIFVTAGLLAISIVSRNRPRTFLVLVSLAVIALSMQAVRNAPLAALVLVPVAGAAMASRWPGARAARDSAVRAPLATAIALVALVALMVGPLSMMKGGRGISLGAPSEEGYPSAGAEYVISHYPGRRLFNDYNAGGYLIYKLYPAVPVFIDGRTDFYGNKLMTDYLSIARAETGWDDLLRSYGVEVVLIDKGLPLADALDADGLWTQQFVAEREVVYVRR